MKALATAAMANPATESGEPLELVAAARAGDLAAFDLLMRRYERLVLATALRLTGGMEDARDASQEVFLRLYRNLGKLKATENLPGWLYRVTVNVCHDQRRKRRIEAPVEEAGEPASPEAGPLETIGRAERARALQKSLARLTERERAVVVLRDLEGLSTGEVAGIMGSTEATVRSQISQARVKMRGFLEGYFRRKS